MSLSDSVTIELFAVDDAPASGPAFSQRTVDGALRIPTVYPGRYIINVFTAVPHYYLESIRLGANEVLGKEVLVSDGAGDITITFNRSTAGLRGVLREGRAASILLLSDEEDLFRNRA